MIKAKRDELLAPLAAVSGIIERRHTLPILSNVLVDGASESLSFLATDIEIQIAAKSGIGGGRDAKAFTVGARKLLDILRAPFGSYPNFTSITGAHVPSLNGFESYLPTPDYPAYSSPSDATAPTMPAVRRVAHPSFPQKK